MSKVITNNVITFNDKMDVVVTATSAINKENVRSEGIDFRNLTQDSPIMKSAQYRYNNWDDGTTNTFTIGTGSGGDLSANMPYGRPAVALSYGIGTGISRITYPDNAPLVLNQGDLLRFHYSFMMWDVKLHGVVATFPIDTNDAGNCIIFFPTYWDTVATTPNNIGNAKIFPGRVDWFSYGVTNPAKIPQTEPPSAATDNEERLWDDGICVYDMAAEEVTGHKETKPMRRLHGCLNYIHESSTPLTIYRLGVASTGFMLYQHVSGGGFDTRCFLQEHPDLNDSYPFELKMERANLGAIVLHKGRK